MPGKKKAKPAKRSSAAKSKRKVTSRGKTAAKVAKRAATSKKRVNARGASPVEAVPPIDTDSYGPPSE